MKKYRLENLDCADCAAHIEDTLNSLSQVRSAKVVFATQSLIIDTDDMECVEKAVKESEPSIVLKDASIKKSVSSFNVKKELAILGGYLFLFAASAMVIKFLPEAPYKYFGFALLLFVYFSAGKDVIFTSIKNISKGKIFDENFLMTFATAAAFAIGAYTESVAVMLFYRAGEFFQALAVNRSRGSIQSLVEIRPDYACVLRSGVEMRIDPDDAVVGDILVVRPGEKIPLDGEIIKGKTTLDMRSLTGESVPKSAAVGETVLAGTLNLSGLIEMKATKLFGQSSVAKILDLVENAAAHKAKTEKFITVFARYYTPAVFFIALCIAVIPPLLNYGAFSDWIYRALVVLVVSCPCALVISVPLGYFGGIGACSKHGILVKGADFLEAMAQVKAVAFDKTGTLTKGVFKVTEVTAFNGFTKDGVLRYAAIAESRSSHPIAQSIKNHYKSDEIFDVVEYEEIGGHGIKTVSGEDFIVAGNDRILHMFNIPHTQDICALSGSIAHIGVNGIYAGYIVVSDEIKNDTIAALADMRKLGIAHMAVLTGDNLQATKSALKGTGLTDYYTNLLPEDKGEKFKIFVSNALGNDGSRGKSLFVGDGINDAPVLALADIGVSMGAAGTDAAIETADVVIMNDSLKKIGEGIRIARKTKTIIWQNILFALGVKGLFVVLGFFGIATMWEAVFGDIGVALIALFNSMRILKYNPAAD